MILFSIILSTNALSKEFHPNEENALYSYHMNRTTVRIIVGAIVGVVVVIYLTTPKTPPAPPLATTSTHSVTPTQLPSDYHENIYLSKTDPTKGAYMTDFAGMTLYTSSDDRTGVSNCTGECAKDWPPYSSGAVSQKRFPANISVITRPDGSKQLAWHDMPLYYYAKDMKVGDLLGDGIDGVWHIVKP